VRRHYYEIDDLKSQHYVMYEQEQPKAIASTVANIMMKSDCSATP
jgi:hypothetical protein